MLSDRETCLSHGTRRAPCFLLALALLHGCSDSAPVAEVLVTGLGPETRSLDVSVDIGGAPGNMPPQVVRQHLDDFFLLLPPSTTGDAVVHVGGLSEMGCRTATGQGRLTVRGAGRYQVAVALKASSPAESCQIVVDKPEAGDGEVGGQPMAMTGWTCAGRQCRASFPPNMMVTISARANKDSYFAGWAGLCNGRDDCKVQTTADAVTVTARFLPRRQCGAEGWCWQNPLPQGNYLNAVWALTKGNAWAVGEVGTILHWDGSEWGAFQSGTKERLTDIWGSGADDIWAVGEGAAPLLHWEKKSGMAPAWGPASPGPGSKRARSSLWGTVTGMPGPGQAVELWVASDNAVLRWDGKTWAQVPTGEKDPLVLWGSGPGDVWMIDRTGSISRYRSGSFMAAGPGAPGVVFSRLWGSGPGDVWALGALAGQSVLFRWDDRAWAQVQSGTGAALYDGWAAGPGEGWVVGQEGTALHWDGRALTPVASGISTDIRTVHGSGPDDVWAIAGGNTLRWNGAFWLRVDRSSGATTAIRAVAGRTPADLWAVGDRGTILRWSGGSWLQEARSGTADGLAGVWASGTADAWAVGERGTIVRWDGTGWMRADSGTAQDLHGVWGSAADDVWAVGGGGTILRWRGKSWAPVAGPAKGALRAVWGSAAADVWAVGDGGAILRWDGASWRDLSLPQSALLSVWGSSAADVWAVGELIAHWDGQRWTTTPLPAGVTQLSGVFAPRPGDAWAAGPAGVRHFDGTTWAPSDSGTSLALWGVGGAAQAPDSVWVAGDGGAILQHALK